MYDETFDCLADFHFLGQCTHCKYFPSVVPWPDVKLSSKPTTKHACEVAACREQGDEIKQLNGMERIAVYPDHKLEQALPCPPTPLPSQKPYPTPLLAHLLQHIWSHFNLSALALCRLTFQPCLKGVNVNTFSYLLLKSCSVYSCTN